MNLKLTPRCLLLAVCLGWIPVSAENQTGCVIYGRVTDLMGNPINGVEIRFSTASKSGSARTNAEGEYEIKGLTLGEYKISAILQGFHVEERLLHLRSDKPVGLDIGMRPGRIIPMPTIQIFGTVRQANKRPVANATVTIVNAFNKDILIQCRTNADGEYDASGIDFGQYIIYAFSPKFEISAATAVLPPKKTDQKKKVDLLLIPLRIN